jgi:hypothetical protein
MLTDVRAKDGWVCGKLTLMRGGESETFNMLPRERSHEIAAWMTARLITAQPPSASRDGDFDFAKVSSSRVDDVASQLRALGRTTSSPAT